MCEIVTTSTQFPYRGVRQVLLRQDSISQEEDVMEMQDFSSIPMEARYYLIAYLRVSNWETACDILAAHPLVVAPWASHFLRSIIGEAPFSAEDLACCREHMLVLDLAQLLGVERTRALLMYHPE